MLQMLLKGAFGFFALALLFFGSAGSLFYTNAWLLLAALSILMLAMGIVLLVKSPETLQRRLKAKEAEKAQRGYIGMIGVLFLLSFVLAGLGQRFGWNAVPLWGVIASLILLVGGYLMYGAVMLQNAYASRVIEVQTGQTVITTGLYGLVRHPMYLACLFIFLPMPLVLGSFIALIPLLPLPILLGLRIKNEEAILRAELPGYVQYMQKTKYRLIPYIW